MEFKIYQSIIDSNSYFTHVYNKRKRYKEEEIREELEAKGFTVESVDIECGGKLFTFWLSKEEF
jgi:riboflavin biosynthesis pyrimidine reductase